MAKEDNTPGFAFEADNFHEVREILGGAAAVRGIYKIALDPAQCSTGPKNSGTEKKGHCTWVRLGMTAVAGITVDGSDAEGSFLSMFADLPDSNVADPIKRKSFNDRAVGRFKGLLLRFGVDKDKLESASRDAKAKRKPLSITPKQFEGKFAYVDYTPKNEELGIAYDKIRFLTEEVYTRIVTAGIVPGGNAAGAIDTSGVEAEQTNADRGGAAQRKGPRGKRVEVEAEPEPEIKGEAAEVAGADEADDDFASI